MTLLTLLDLVLLLLSGVAKQTANETDDTVVGLAIAAMAKVKEARDHVLTQERLLNYRIEPRW